MPRSLTALFGYLCLYVSSQLWAAPPPVMAFGRSPAMTSVALSPGGDLIAWISNEGTQPRIEIFDLAKGAIRSRIGTPLDIKVRDLSWFDQHTLFISGSMAYRPRAGSGTTYEIFRTLALDINTGKSTMLLHGSGVFAYLTGSALLSMRTSTPNKVIIASWNFSATNFKQPTGSRLTGGRKDEGWTYDLHEVDTTTGEPRLIERGTPFTNSWVVDAAGQPVARSEWQASRSTYALLHRRGLGWSEIFRLDTGEVPTVLGLANDGSGILMRAALHRPHTALWRVPFDGSTPQVLIGPDRSDIARLIRDPYSQAVIGAWSAGVNPQAFWLDEEARARAQALTKTFAGKTADLMGRSADNTRALLAVGTHATPTVYYLIDYKKGTADIVGEEYPALANAPLGKVQELTYKARDGYEIPAFVTLPPGANDKQLALVVLPHDGPESRDPRVFDGLVQFIASRGYAVLQPQFRGSTGYGEAHRKAGYLQWGRLMQDDVTDGVKALIERGTVDPKRVCIAGMGGYGGYAALAGAAFTPELYVCAVSINGVSDLPAMLGHVEARSGEESDSMAYWRDHIGSPTNPEVIAKSPTRAAAAVRVPILLLHGVDDARIPVTQSRAMAKALKTLGKPHTLIELSGEDHWLSRSESRIRVLTEMETFLATHLGAPRAQ